MISNELCRALVFSVPLVSALVCLVLTLFNTFRPFHPVRRKIDMRMFATYGHLVLVWTGFVLYSIDRMAFIYGLAVFVPVVMVAAVSTYRLMLTNTDTGDRPKIALSMAHFIAPALIYVLMVVVVVAIPFSRLEEVIYGSQFNIVKSIVITLCAVYAIAYPSVGIVEIVRYRRMIKDDKLNSRYHRMLGWLMGMTIAEIVMFVPSAVVLMLALPPITELHFAWWLPAVLPSAMTYLVVCYTLLSDNYLIIEPETPTVTTPAVEITTSEARLNRARVETYLDEKKPWLNPAYRITDMAEDLYSNRAYISAFINREFGMNFNRFINSYRLAEVERLRSEATARKQKVSTLQLIMNAGFSSYRSYLRAKDGGKDDEGTDKPSARRETKS